MGKPSATVAAKHAMFLVRLLAFGAFDKRVKSFRHAGTVFFAQFRMLFECSNA